ncbi:MAG: hypothetical protein HRT47_04810 [Candidatus Caenarcaniphilales bacterium]|nr:hypothetical protein [Candidatus Caenarcaniphilales bacterium]
MADINNNKKIYTPPITQLPGSTIFENNKIGPKQVGGARNIQLPELKGHQTQDIDQLPEVLAAEQPIGDSYEPKSEFLKETKATLSNFAVKQNDQYITLWQLLVNQDQQTLDDLDKVEDISEVLDQESGKQPADKVFENLYSMLKQPELGSNIPIYEKNGESWKVGRPTGLSKINFVRGTDKQKNQEKLPASSTLLLSMLIGQLKETFDIKI